MMNNARLIGVTQLLLLSPGVLFMGSLVARSLSPLQNQPAHTAQQIVMWYAARMWTLWVLLIALPLAVLVTGCFTFARAWNKGGSVARAGRHLLSFVTVGRSTRVVAATTLTSAVILAIVVLHMAAN